MRLPQLQLSIFTIEIVIFLTKMYNLGHYITETGGKYKLNLF